MTCECYPGRGGSMACRGDIPRGSPHDTHCDACPCAKCHPPAAAAATGPRELYLTVEYDEASACPPRVALYATEEAARATVQPWVEQTCSNGGAAIYRLNTEQCTLSQVTAWAVRGPPKASG